MMLQAPVLRWQTGEENSVGAGLQHVMQGHKSHISGIHPVPCADLLSNGQTPVTHFLVSFLPVSFVASSSAGAMPKRSQHYSQRDERLV